MSFQFNWWIFLLSIPAYFIYVYIYRTVKRKKAIKKLEKLAWEDVDTFVYVATNHESWEVSPYKTNEGNWITIRFAPDSNDAFYLRYIGPKYIEKYSIDGLTNLVNEARQKGSTFNQELERYSKLQQIAGTYMLFKFYIDEQADWEFAENVDNDEGWIILHPYPEVAPSHCYYIRYIGNKDLSTAVDEMMDDFLLSEENRHYREKL